MKRLIKRIMAFALTALTLFGTVACGKVEMPQGVKEYLCVEHTYGEGEVERWSTCIREGRIKHTCTECGNVKYVELARSAHTPYTVPARAATCALSGYTEHTACAICQTVISGKETIPKTPCDHTNDFYAGMGIYECGLCHSERMEYQEESITGKHNRIEPCWYRVYLPNENSKVTLEFFGASNQPIGEYTDTSGLVHDLFRVTFTFDTKSDVYVLGGGVDMTWGHMGADYIQFFLDKCEYTGEPNSATDISWFTLDFSLVFDYSVTLEGGAKFVKLQFLTDEGVSP